MNDRMRACLEQALQESAEEAFGSGVETDKLVRDVVNGCGVDCLSKAELWRALELATEDQSSDDAVVDWIDLLELT